MSAKKFVEQNAEILSDEEIENIRTLAQKLEAATRTEDKDLINREMETLNEYTAPLAHRALDENIKKAMTGKKI
ncbi:MAG: hypothetical protein D6714_15000 [Bacteroidetes bacterium]|nr:MAG: hypothetical protein D6714_15000 [Bacteroidota bacterium]